MSFTVYRSSAGSGKTYTLVKEYLKLVLEEPEGYRHVLAVTFTNKAAGEMKRRVLACLEELSGPIAGEGRASRDLLPDLVKETDLTKEVIADRSAGTLKGILHNYSDFSIGTIDSFSHRIIRAFAYDFGLPVNFRVELDADELIETAVDLLLDKAGDDQEVTSTMVDFLESSMEDDKSWDIAASLRNFAKLLMDEESQEYLPRLRHLEPADFGKIAAYLFKRIRAFEKELSMAASSGWEAIRGAGVSAEAFAYGKSGVFGYLEKLAAGSMKKIDPGARIRSLAEKRSWSGPKASSADKESIEAISGILEESLGKIFEILELQYSSYSLFRLLSGSIYPLALLSGIDRILQDFKKQNNLIHISEFNSRIAQIVMGEPVPFIYERTGERYRNILIDEFQDTSALQWQNFVPLIENSLAGGQFNLVVGDGKQAIYRFRNGDVEQFAALPSLKGSSDNSLLAERESALSRNFKEKELRVNYRSSREIVSFNNDLFGFARRFLDERRAKVYERPEQECGSKDDGGYVRISFVAGGGKNEETFEISMLNAVRELIMKCIEDGFRFFDIALLCRSNPDASLVAAHLVDAGIPVVSGESLLLRNSGKVKLLVALARHVFLPEDPLTQAEILFTGRQYDSGTLDLLNDWLDCGKDTARRKAILAGFMESKIGPDPFASLKALPVFDLFIKLASVFLPRQGDDAYLQSFLNAVLGFGMTRPSSAADFLEWWDQKSAKLPVLMPEDRDAVQVMTVHKAKGLQFPVVIHPFAGDNLAATRNFIWGKLDREDLNTLPLALLKTTSELGATEFAGLYEEERQKSQLDLLNILYVALTRPEKRLYIMPPMPPGDSGKGQSVPAILKEWLIHKGLWNEKELVYEFGRPEKLRSSRPEKDKSRTMPPTGFTDWRNNIRIRSSAPALWNLDDPDRNKRYGNVLHTLLAGLDKSRDYRLAVERMVEQGLLEKGADQEIRNKVEKILTDPGFAFIFDDSAEVRTEREILAPSGQSFRPDRVILKGDHAVIVDYKTGKPMEKYRSQLLTYASFLRELGYTQVDSYLLYLEPEVRLEQVN
jgi:ATP-dependent exoDNAse (exonuclease V) beta subunit